MSHPSSTRNREDFAPAREGISSREFKDAAQSVAATAAEKAKETASSMADKAKEAASSIGQTASDVASTVGQKAKDATSAVGGGMQSLAESIRHGTPHEGMLGSASSAVAGTLESGGRYLQEEGLGGMAQDLTNTIRRNPIPSVLIGIGLGFLLARTMRS